MEYRKYICPIYCETISISPLTSRKILNCKFKGNGFFVGNYFITAGHVINQFPDSFINYNDKKLYIKSGKEIILKDMPYDEYGRPVGHKDPKNADLAIYEFYNMEINSPLCLSNSFPQLGQELQSNFYHYKLEEIEKYKITQEIENESLVYWECTGTVHEDSNDHCGDFFEATMKPAHPWGGGSSGSPILNGNIVCGILHAGGAESHPDICVYFSAERALLAIQKHKGDIK